LARSGPADLPGAGPAPGPGHAESRPNAAGGADERAGPVAAQATDSDEIVDPDDLDPHGEDVDGDALTWAQDRLMEAFPGAEEV